MVLPKIVHMTSAHPPFDNRIFYKECRTLVQAGYEVVLIVQHDRQEVIHGVRIVPITISQTLVQRMVLTIWKILKTALDEDAYVYHFHDPELILIGMLLKMRGKRVVYDVHENVPDHFLLREYIPIFLRGFLGKLAGMVELLAAMFFDGMIAATPTIAQRFSKRKTVVVKNFPIVEKHGHSEMQEYMERSPLVVYAGGITIAKGIKEMVEAMAFLPDNVEANLILAGNFSPPELEREVSQLAGWERVTFTGWQSGETIVSFIARARIGLVVLHPLASYVDSLPTKLFDYMAAGIPVVASDFVLFREIIEGANCGILVDPQDSEAIAEAIHWLLRHPQEAKAMGVRGLQAIQTRYNWTNETEQLLDFYKRLIPSSKNVRSYLPRHT